MWGYAKNAGRPLWYDLHTAKDLPHTITFAMSLRERYNSYLELSEPIPEEYWDHPHLCRSWINRLYPGSKKGNTSGVLELNENEIES